MDVMPHDPPVEIFPDLLFIHGSMRMGPGMVINRNMVAVRHDGEVTLINPIRLDAPGEQALTEFGAVRHVMRLGPYHGVDDAYTVERFDARFWCQTGSDKHPEPKPDVLIEEGMQLPFPDAELFVYRETTIPECAVLLQRHGGVLLTCDSIQHWESTSRCSFLAKGLTYAMGFLHPANIGPPWKRSMTKKGGSLRPDFDRLLERSFENLIGAHGQVLQGGANQALRASVERAFG